MSQVIDKSKTYRTRDGKEVRIYATDGGGDYPVHGALCDNGIWIVTSWTKEGRYYKNQPEHGLSLIEVVPLIERWAVIRKSDGHCIGTYKMSTEANVCIGNHSEEYRIVNLREVVE
jgi:hypothetical protein